MADLYGAFMEGRQSTAGTDRHRADDAWRNSRAKRQAEAPPTPIPMILFCPDCGLQHIDTPDAHDDAADKLLKGEAPWDNPPHRSHLCAGCGHIWRPADVPTTGVAEIATQGKADHQPPIRKRSGRCIGGCDGPVDMEP